MTRQVSRNAQRTLFCCASFQELKLYHESACTRRLFCMSLNTVAVETTPTPAIPAGFKNYTVDDASPALTYKGFLSNQEAGSAISFDTSQLFTNSISYTMSAQATASFQFAGTAQNCLCQCTDVYVCRDSVIRVWSVRTGYGFF